jgi:hypothetical protein
MSCFSNVNPWKVETALNFRETLDNWNCTTMYWLRRVAYERVPKNYRTVSTYFLSAMWHGFFLGYYMVSFLLFEYLNFVLDFLDSRFDYSGCSVSSSFFTTSLPELARVGAFLRRSYSHCYSNISYIRNISIHDSPSQSRTLLLSANFEWCSFV